MMLQHDAHTPSPHNLIPRHLRHQGRPRFDPGPPRFSKGRSLLVPRRHEDYAAADEQ